MCGRYILTAAPEAVAKAFGYRDAAWFPPRHNIAPSQPIGIVRHVRRTREFALVRWGLIPGWAKDPRRFTLLVNARAEGLAGKAAFRGPLQYRRCLVPATGYYQWQRGGAGPPEPWLVRRRDGGLIGFAGLWEAWMGSDGSEIDTACIITTRANSTLAPLGDRMPAIIPLERWGDWLDSDHNAAAAAVTLLRPAEEAALAAFRVGMAVNSAGNDDPSLVAPLPAAGPGC